MEEIDYKPTDLDYLTGNHHLQMMKAALPYMNVQGQRMMSLFVKTEELRKTMELFQNKEVAAMGICSLTPPAPSSSPSDSNLQKMFSAVKTYASPQEQDFINLLSNFIQGASISQDQIKNLISPELRSRIETMQMMMQVMKGASSYE